MPCRCLYSALLVSSALLVTGCALPHGKKIREPVAPVSSADSIEFREATGSLLGQSFVPGNNIVTLVNGDEIFPVMLQAIRSAKVSINFETYVYWNGEIARELTEALAERDEAGVKVHAVLDAQGTHKMGLENVARLR